jgi:hypothetical protein
MAFGRNGEPSASDRRKNEIKKNGPRVTGRAPRPEADFILTTEPVFVASDDDDYER